MKRKKLFLWSIVAFVFLLPLVNAAGSAIKGANFDSIGNGQLSIINTQDNSQSFNSTYSGILTNISLYLSEDGTPTTYTEVLIYTALDGLPVSKIANFTRIEAVTTTASCAYYNSSGNVTLVANQEYAVVLHSANLVGANPTFCVTLAGGYPNGTVSTGNGDFGSFTKQAYDGGFTTWYNSSDFIVSTISPPNLTVTATDEFDGTAISNFTAILSGNGNITYVTGNGTILITNTTNGIYNITITSNQSGGYFNRTYSQFNISSNTLSVRIWQAELYINATNFNGVKINDFGVRTNGSSNFNFSNSTGFATLRVKAGTYNVTGNATSYFNNTKTISVANKATNALTLNFTANQLKVAVVDFFSGNTISSFSAEATGLNVSFFTSESTSTGNATLEVISGNYSVTVSGATIATTTANITVDETLENYTFRVYSKGAIVIRTYFEGTNNLITSTSVKAQFDSDISVFNMSTLNGTIYAEMSTPTTYTITMSASGFTNRQYVVTLDSGSYSELNAYLLNSSSSTSITINSLDGATSDNLPGVLVSVYDKINITPALIAQRYTDIIGEAIFDLDTTQEYNFVLTKDGYITETFSLIPNTDTVYPVTLFSTSSTASQSLGAGIQYIFSPSANNQLNNGTNYNLTFELTSTYWNISDCIFIIENLTTVLAQAAGSFNRSACYANITINTGQQSKLYATAIYTIDDRNQTQIQTYSVKLIYRGEYSLKKFFDDINSFTDAGFDPLARALIGFFMIFGLVGYLSYKEVVTYAEPERAIIIIIISTWAVCSLGFFTVENINIPSIGNQTQAFIQQYMVAALVTVMGIGYLTDREYR